MGKSRIIMRKDYPPGVVHYEERVRVVLSEMFELNEFPFDPQTLTMKVRLHRKQNVQGDVGGDQSQPARRQPYVAHTVRQKVNNSTGSSSVRLDKEIQLADWHLFKPCVTAGIAADTKTSEQSIRVHVALRRRHGFYSYNILLTHTLICTMGLAAFKVPVEHFVDRSAIVLTLILTSVAFRLAVESSIPKVPYTTLLSIQFVAGLIFLVAIFTENGFVSDPALDKMFFLLFVALWSVFQVGYCLASWWFLVRVKRELGKEINTEAVDEFEVAKLRVCFCGRRKTE